MSVCYLSAAELSVEIILKSLEDALLCGVVALEVVALPKFLYSLMLVLAESLWHIDTDVDHKVAVASAVALHRWQTLSAQTESLARLCARLNLNSEACALYRGNLNITSKGSRREVEQQIVYQVIAVANEGVVVLLLDKHLNVARHSVVGSGVALSRNVNHHTLSHTGRDVDLNNLLTFHNTRAMARLTLVLYHAARAVAGGTNTLCLHHAEDALSGVRDNSAAMTCGTCLAAAASLGATAVTSRARNVLAHLELLVHARCHLRQRQAHL